MTPKRPDNSAIEKAMAWPIVRLRWQAVIVDRGIVERCTTSSPIRRKADAQNYIESISNGAADDPRSNTSAPARSELEIAEFGMGMPLDRERVL